MDSNFTKVCNRYDLPDSVGKIINAKLQYINKVDFIYWRIAYQKIIEINIFKSITN